MSKNIALGIIIGGAVGSTLGRAVADAKGKIGGLKKDANSTRLWQKAIGDTQKLRSEIARIGAAGGDITTLGRKLEAQEAKLKRHGIAVHNLDAEYSRLGRTVKGLELKAKGLESIGRGIETGKSAIGQAVALTGAVAIPSKVSADYQAIIRDIAIKAGIAGTAQEAGMSRDIIGAAGGAGIGRDVLAQAVNALVTGGMEVKKAVAFAPLIGKFSVGQGSEAPVTAEMVRSLEGVAKIFDPAGMGKAMETIAYLGKAGSFEAGDMAKWFPALLGEMGNKGILGQDAVQQLGAMLQIQIKTAANADEAANNLKNWFSKIGAGATVDAYGADGIKIDYQKEMNKLLGKGLSTLEASFELARMYIEKADPEKAKMLAEAGKKLSKETDPEKVKRMAKALEETLKTGDLFNDMQVKAALTAYMQNKDLYFKLKAEGAKASGEIDRDLAARRETSRQIWAEAEQAGSNAMRAIGDALLPLTNWAGQNLASLGKSVSNLAEKAPGAAVAVTGVATALVALGGALAAGQIVRGAANLARGTAIAAGAGGVGAGAAAAGGAAAGGLLGRLGLGRLVGSLGRAAAAGARPGGQLFATGVIGYEGARMAGAGVAGEAIGRAVYNALNKNSPWRDKPQGHAENIGAEVAKALPKPPPPKIEKTVNQHAAFSPHINVTVKVDQIDGGKLAAAIMPHLQGVFARFQSQTLEAAKSIAFHDEPHL